MTYGYLPSLRLYQIIQLQVCERLAPLPAWKRVDRVCNLRPADRKSSGVRTKCPGQNATGQNAANSGICFSSNAVSVCLHLM